jgi:putative DNA primase/helicase
LRYAALGLRVIPIKPGQKSPAPIQWVEAATNDPDIIRGWWTGLYRDHGIGLVLGQVRDDRWLFAVDIDQHGADGAAVWAEMCAKYCAPPDTVTALTGGGGTHHVYWAPFEIRNSRLADGIDIRGAGGQILVEPTIHPNGQPYSWEDGYSPFEHKFARAPEWLLEALTPAEPEPRPAAPTAGDRPGDLWAAETTWATLLEADGWTWTSWPAGPPAPHPVNPAPSQPAGSTGTPCSTATSEVTGSSSLS